MPGARLLVPPASLGRLARGLLLLLAGVALVAGSLPAPAAAVGGDSYVQLSNQKRASGGLAPVALSAAADQIAVERAEQLAASDVFAHDMAYVGRRLKEIGVCHSTYGEIIAWEKGYASYSYQRTIEAWWASPGHRAIMVGDYNGAGGSWSVSSKSGITYSVMIFVKLCAPAATQSATTITRLAGADRYATAAAVSAQRFAPGVSVAYVATGENFPDALAVGALAAVQDAPVLLVRAGSLPAATADELARLRPGRIVVVGGPSVVSDGVVAALARYTTGGVRRVAGPDRFATAAAVSASGFRAGVPVAYIATGMDFGDALVGGPAAARDGGPVLLARTDALPASTASELARLRPGRIVVVGGPTGIGDGVVATLQRYTTGSVSRLAGGDRYQTGVAVSSTFAAGTQTVYVATGEGYADGLTGGATSGGFPGPLVLVPSASLPSVVAGELQRLAPRHVVVVGGPSVISDAVVGAIDAALP
jgi:putative cell wall-binding protein